MPTVIILDNSAQLSAKDCDQEDEEANGNNVQQQQQSRVHRQTVWDVLLRGTFHFLELLERSGDSTELACLVVCGGKPCLQAKFSRDFAALRSALYSAESSPSSDSSTLAEGIKM